MNLYVIGPVTGKPNRNLEAFEAARSALERRGHVVTIPHDVIDETLEWSECMRRSIVMMLCSMIDGVACLDDYAESRGASVERKIAQTCGVPVMTVAEWLR